MGQNMLLGKVIAHRGASAYAPENTFSAFNKALALGCCSIECDVMLSADGEAYVMHDTTLTRTTNGLGEVGLVTSEYLKSLDAGKWFSSSFQGEKIPHFSELIQWLNFTNMNANIEIKPYPGTAHQTTIAVLSCINREWLTGKPSPLVSSFDHSALQLCRELAPEMPLGMLMHSWDENWLTRAQELKCYSVHVNHRVLTSSRVKTIKDQGYCVLAYVVNRKRRAQKLFEWGVDAVFSDYPDLLGAVVNSTTMPITR